MKYTKLLSLFTLLLLIGMSSCKEDEIVVIDEPIIEEIVPVITTSNQLVFNVESNSGSADGLDLDCFTVDFPFGLNVDGTVTEINSEEEFFAALDEEPELIDFVYPINVTYTDGETAVANDGEELGALFASCIPDNGWTGNDGFPAFLICDINSCFQLVYPVGLNDGNGNDVTANSEEEFIDLIVNNPELYFNFPISLTDVDGMTVTATNDEELFNLFLSCEDNFNPGNDTTDYGVGGIGCLDFIFPINVLDQDGVEVTIADENEFVNAMFTGNISTFVYPISLEDQEGNIVVANSDEEINDLLFACEDIPFIVILFQNHISMSSLMNGTCYDLIYPFSGLNIETGETIEVINDEAAIEALNNQVPIFLNFPVSFVQISTGETIVLYDSDTYIEFIEDNCQ